MTEEGHLIIRFDPLDRMRKSPLDIAVIAPDARIRGGKPRLQMRANGGAGDSGILAEIPAHRQRLRRSLRLPPCISHDRDGIRKLHHAADAFHAGDLALLD